MRRITGTNAVELAAGKLGFRDRSTSQGLPGTVVIAEWLNDVQEELLSLVEGVGLAPAAARDQLYTAVRALGVPYAADTGAANALVVNLNRSGFSWVAGAAIRVRVAAANTDVATIHVLNGVADLGTYALVRPDGAALCPYDLAAGQIVALVYDGTSVQIPRVEGRTGDMLLRLAGTSLGGHVPLNGLTIGPEVSGATNRAHADCRQLYTYLWGAFSDALCPVAGGRGVSAAADWAAGKPLTTPDTRCRSLIGVDGMGGAAQSAQLTGVPFSAGDAATPGSRGGEARHVLTNAELPPISYTPGGSLAITLGNPLHAHVLTDPGHAHGVSDPGHVHGISDPGHAHHTVADATGGTYPPAADSLGLTYNNLDGGQALAYLKSSATTPATLARTSTEVTGISIQAQATSVAVQTAGAGITLAQASAGVYVAAATFAGTAAQLGGSASPANNMPPFLTIVVFARL